MLKKSMSEYCRKALVITSTLWMFAGLVVLPGQVLAQQHTTDSSSVSRQNDSVQTSASHHYQNPAERAKDDLLITEVKSDLAKDGVADDRPVAVDCDHGKIRLSGVIGSAEEAKRAGDIAAEAPGVVAVVNQLTWRK
jgi:osmotically-inducible protein OsmY